MTMAGVSFEVHWRRGSDRLPISYDDWSAATTAGEMALSRLAATNDETAVRRIIDAWIKQWGWVDPSTISVARHMLTDPAKRDAFDAWLAQQVEPGGPHQATMPEWPGP